MKDKNNNVKDIYFLTPMQEGILFSYISDKKSSAYFAQYTYTVKGQIDLNMFEQSFNTIINKYDILRTVFIFNNIKRPIQIVLKARNGSVEYKDILHLSKEEKDTFIKTYEINDIKRGFDLEKDMLTRISLIRINDYEYEIVWSFHHIIMDGWSLGIILRDFIEEYVNLKNGIILNQEPVVQYGDYIRWVEKQEKTSALNYWKKQLQGYHMQALAFETHKSLNYPSYMFKSSSSSLNNYIMCKLNKIVIDNSITMNTIFETAWGILLCKYNMKKDVVYGKVVSGRSPKMHMVENIAGLFINTIPIRIRYDEGSSFIQVAKKTQQESLNSLEHSYVSLTDIQTNSNLDRGFINHIIVFENYPIENKINKMLKNDEVGFSIESSNDLGQTNYNLALSIFPGKNVEIIIKYNCFVYESFTIDRILEHFINILRDVAENPEVMLSEIEMLSEEEKSRLLVDFNNTCAEYPKDKTIHKLFEEQVERVPNNIAVVYENTEITYRELNKKANQLARVLREKGVKPDSIVGIMVEKSLEMIVGIMGILKAGGAYLPIDPRYPRERIGYMLNDSGSKLLLSKESLIGNIEFKGEIIDLFDENLFKGNFSDLEIVNSPENLVYVIYTSGTTGKSKGVMVKHYSLVNYCSAIIEKAALTSSDETALLSSYAFDLGYTTVFTALTTGIKLNILSEERYKDPQKLMNFLKSGITYIKITPSLFSIIANFQDDKAVFDNSKLRLIILGGESINIKDINKFISINNKNNISIMNHYGPTESTIGCISTLIDLERLDEFNNIIGRPIYNTKIYIVDKGNKLLPIGVVGELCIAGDGLARGYLNRPELTEEKFIQNPFKLKTKMYRTGDLARWLPDGNIEFLGRTDNQVKIRGFRIELGEIENEILKNQEIKEAVVVDKEDTQGNKYLCAYIVSDREMTVLELRGYLSRELPDYMIPSYFILIEKMPLTPNGKIDKRALPEPEGGINTGTEYVAPRGAIEENLVRIWSEVLGVEKIGIDDDFFTLGGHSLKAMRVISIIHKVLNVEVPVGEVFSNPTIRQLGEYIGEAKERIYSSIKQVKEKEVYKVSSAQKRLFALNQFNKEATNYNMPSVIKVEGKLEKKRVEEVLRKIVERHEAFRTSFELVNEEIVQRIHKEVEFNVEYEEAKEVEEVKAIVEKFIRPFDLSKAPLLRVKLVRINEEKHILMFDMHHIVSDGTTIGILIEEFTNIYKGKELKSLRIQYKDFAAWENERLDSEDMKKQEEYWMRVFSDEIPVLDMPTDYQRPTLQSFEGNKIGFKVGKELAEKIKRIGEVNGATMYMTLLSAYSILLSRYSGQEDIIVGSPIAGRVHADLKGIVGMFVNTLAMRTYPKGEKTFKEFLEDVKKNSLRAYENQHYQFDDLVEKIQLRRDLSRNALFDTMFVLQNTKGKEIEMGNLRFEAYSFENKVSKFDLTLTAEETDNEIGFSLEYCTKLFKRGTAERIIEHFLNILREIAENPEIKLSEIEMLSGEEKRRILVDFNDTTTEYPKDKTIHELFEEQVERTPNSIAVVYEDTALTYRELNEEANKLARVLREKGVKPDNIVGIMVDRSFEMMVGIMGILKAGGAYLPIDPEYPEDRIEYMLEDSNTNILLSQSHLMHKVKFDGMAISLQDKGLYGGNKDNLEKVNSSHDIAYVIYTSGSTGNPKGVMIEHRNAANFIDGVTSEIQMKEKESILALTTISFDIFFLETLLPVTKGLKVIIADSKLQKNANYLSDFICENNINILQATPSRIQLLENSDKGLSSLSKVEKLLVGGEALPQSLFEELRKLNGPKIYNMYGPTETTVWSSIKELTNSNEVNIGNPISNTRIYIVGEGNRLQPIGIAGELCITGNGLARGYLNRTELTEEKFVVNPYEQGERMYRTGDLAKWMPDGDIEFLGRIDHQVKIRGFRIELGEIENQLLKNEAIKEVAVIDREDKQGNKYLCAYIVSGKEMIIPELRAYLSKELPDYMIPSNFMQIEKLPLTPNGKIDRKALPELEGDIKTGVEYVAPRNKMEVILAEVWSDVLGIEKIGIDDDFFALGGHSLKAIKLEVMLEKMGLYIEFSKFYQHKTIRHIAENINASGNYTVKDIQEGYVIKKSTSKIEALHQDLDDCAINSKMILKNIEPFNEVFYKSCFYNSLFPVICHFNKNELSVLVNDVIMYHNNQKDEVFSLGIDYLSVKPIEQVITETEINYITKTKNENLVQDIMHALDNDRCVIVWIDCFYESIRTDAYQKKHVAHTLLIYGYDKIQENFNILEHLDEESLSYGKRIIKFGELIASYEGFLRNYGNDGANLSYFEFFASLEDRVGKTFSERESNTYLQTYLCNLKDQRELYISQLEVFQAFVQSFKVSLTEESILKQNAETIVQGINNIINAKQVERYKIVKLFNDDFEGIKLLNEIVDNWMFIRSIVVKFIFTSVYKQKSFELAVSKLEHLYQIECEYCNKILNFIG